MTPSEIARVALTFFDIEPPKEGEFAEFVAGGLKHRLLHVATQDAHYALKLWSPRSTSTAPERAQLEQAETVASLAAQSGIPALTAWRGAGDSAGRKFLYPVRETETGAQWVSLYPWLEGKTLPPTATLPTRCAKMGAHLGALHALKIRFMGQSEPAPEAFERGHFAAILERAQKCDAPFAMPLKRVLDKIEEANALAMRAQLRLRAEWVTGHLDFDQKNVLWQNEKPTILDWESAKPVHPALEAMGAALNWAGQSAGAPKQESFAAFLCGYRGANRLDQDALDIAVDGVLGKWIIWLEFNLQRLLEPQIVGTAEAPMALNSGLHALSTTLQLQKDAAIYRDWLSKI